MRKSKNFTAIAHTEMDSQNISIQLEFDGYYYQAFCTFTKEINEKGFIYLGHSTYLSTDWLPNQVTFFLKIFQNRHKKICYFPILSSKLEEILYAIYADEIMSCITNAINWKEYWT